MVSMDRVPERSALFDQTNGIGGVGDAVGPAASARTHRLVAAALAGFGGLGR